MNNLEMRIRVQQATQNLVDEFMYSNGVSPSMMEDALSKILVNLKDRSLQEFITSVDQEQQAALEAQQTQAAKAKEKTETEVMTVEDGALSVPASFFEAQESNKK